MPRLRRQRPRPGVPSLTVVWLVIAALYLAAMLVAAWRWPGDLPQTFAPAEFPDMGAVGMPDAPDE